MKSRIINVFYDENGYPFKDQERSVRFPIVGSGFMGASNTTQIKFYFKEIGDDAVKYVAVSKLPNGKVGSKVLENYYDSELDEPYALLELDSYYTQYKGDLFISLQGYQGGVQVTYDEDTELYEIEGTPTIQATGSIKFTNNYATQFVGSGEEENITLQQLLAIISDTVLRYYVTSSNTLAEVFNEIGTKICAIDIEGDEYLCKMSGDTNIVLYDIHNQEWYAFTGANTTTIDTVLQDSNKQIVATKEDLENFGNLFTYKGAASVSEINALTDIGNGWCYNLTDSGTLTLGNLQVETGDNVAFDGTIWTKLSSETILGQYYTKQEGQEFENDIDNRVDAIENQVQQVAQGSPKGVYATLNDLETAYPTGAEGIYVVSADGHWYYWNGSAWTDGGAYLSSQDELDTYVVNKNILFGGYDETLQQTFGAGYGVLFKRMFIPKGAYITITCLTNPNANGLYIDYADGTTELVMSNFVNGQSVSFYAKKDIADINTSASYNDISFKIQIEPIITENQNNIKELQNNFTPKNLFDKNAVTAGWIGTNNGVVTTSGNHSTSDFIPIKSQTTYVLKMNMAPYYGETGARRIPLFDENYNFVTYVSGTLNNGILTFTTPIFSQAVGTYPRGNFKYCRFSSYNNDLDNVMFVEGDTYPSEYIGYGETLLASDIGLNSKQKQEVADAVPTNNLYGKYMAGCGDSIMESRTTGGMINGGAWEKIIGDRNDMQVNNIALSGSTLSNYYSDSNVFDASRTIYKQLETLSDTYDFIAFDGGVNDFAKNINLGTITTTYADGSSNYNCDTILGGLEAMCSRLVFHHQTAKKLFVFNHRIYANTDEKTNIGTWSYFVQQIKAVLEKWGIPYIDLEIEVPPINMLDSSFKTTYTCNGDGWHPNELGYTTFYCDKIETKLRGL